jgi:hypothetical protein
MSTANRVYGYDKYARLFARFDFIQDNQTFTNNELTCTLDNLKETDELYFEFRKTATDIYGSFPTGYYRYYFNATELLSPETVTLNWVFLE